MSSYSSLYDQFIAEVKSATTREEKLKLAHRLIIDTLVSSGQDPNKEDKLMILRARQEIVDIVEEGIKNTP